MKIPKEPLSAFAVYSERLKQKKKNLKLVSANGGVNKVNKKMNKTENNKTNANNSLLNVQQMKEIGMILTKLAKQSSKTSDVNNRLTFENVQIKEKKTKGSNTISLNLTSKMEKKGAVNNSVNSKSQVRIKSTSKIKPRSKSGEDLSSKQTNIFLGGTKNNAVEDTLIKKIVTDFNCESTKWHGPIKNTSEKNILNIKVQNKSPSVEKGKLRKRKLLGSQQLRNETTSNITEQLQITDEIPTRNKNLAQIDLENVNHVKKREKGKFRKQLQNKQEMGTVAKNLFEWLILPVPHEDFMRAYWEKQPLLIKREENQNYYSELLSTPQIDRMLRENIIYFTKHLDVTSYTDGVRETHNLTGRAQPNVVWDFYSNGCSIRLLNPQAFIPNIHKLNATLQEYFGCFVGANVYLTPPNSQGFAPHYDDIEAFVLQIEGKKNWKVYHPRSDEETLPRFSSPNFSQEEIGQSCLDVTLEPGDMLYFPRGFIHQASTVEGEHSLHITLSVYQKTAWVDLLEKTLPLALKRAAADDVDFRRGLPRDYLGLEHHGSHTAKALFLDKAQQLMSKLGHYVNLSLGAGVDLMGAQFMHDALPPYFSTGEKQNSVLDSGLRMEKNGKVVNRVEFQMETQVRLIKSNVCRLVEEEEEVRLYHCLDNSLEYHAEEPQYLVLPPEDIQVITFLAKRFPAFSAIKKIPHEDDNTLLTLVSDLWDAGLLVTKELETVDAES